MNIYTFLHTNVYAYEYCILKFIFFQNFNHQNASIT